MGLACLLVYGDIFPSVSFHVWVKVDLRTATFATVKICFWFVLAAVRFPRLYV
jgi:hypothetical protein